MTVVMALVLAVAVEVVGRRLGGADDDESAVEAVRGPRRGFRRAG